MISIIIPTLNEEKYLGSLLRFLQYHADRSKYEVIVVDGGSEDQTPQIAKSFQIVRFYQSNQTSRAHQMNQGAKVAKVDILYFVHADVKLVESFVDDISKEINSGTESGCYRYRFTKPHHPLLHINGFFTRFPFSWCRGGDQTLFISKDRFEQLGGFDESFVIMEDYEFLDRLSKAGICFKVIPRSIEVSARKYLNNSYWKVQMINLKAMSMYKRGVSPDAIRSFYRTELN
ncbi:MAG: TIGR04283 family arsenosugar biosynthesis glycosyltransferase [Ekhidna sp.]|uniref:TIGR04283 family arsenosugar biosynthesis glycosyltransferase n=1 Tax=Ekhidna sp. TaxID=2608089 RepID=UPI0032EFA9A2